MDSRLINVVSAVDSKIERQLSGKENVHFFAADVYGRPFTDEQLISLHEKGFDNYPMAGELTPDPMFFMERIIGCKLHHIDGKTDFVHTFCVPCIERPGDIDKLRVDLSVDPVWQPYFQKLSSYANSSGNKLPVMLPSFCPLDCACDIMGAENFFFLMLDDPDGTAYVLDFITRLYTQMINEIQSLAVKTVNYYGFPGTEASDLNTGNISPAMLSDFVLPCYQRAAQAVGGLFINVGTDDEGFMREVISVKDFTGFSFDKRIPYEKIDKMLGKKLFITYNYFFLGENDEPRKEDVNYSNPIVGHRGAFEPDLIEAYSCLAQNHSMLAYIQRFTLQEIEGVVRHLTTISG